MPIGRPSIYATSVGEAIASALASGKPITKICRSKGMPALATVFRWLQTNLEFRELYARAREMQVEALVSEIIDISDTTRPGERVEKKHVGWRCPKCGLDVKWFGDGWYHGSKDNPICAGHKPEKVFETKTVTGDTVERSRLQVEARKWYASKVMPKKYGDRLELAGDKDSPIQVISVSETLRRRRATREEQVSPKGQNE